MGLDAVAGGAGADWATCLRLLERAAAAAANVAGDVGVGGVHACVEGCLFVPGGELNEIKNRKKTSLPYMAAYR